MTSSCAKITGLLTLVLLVLSAGTAFPRNPALSFEGKQITDHRSLIPGVLTGQDVDQAKRALEAAIQSQDAAALQEAVNQLVTINNDKAVRALMAGQEVSLDKAKSAMDAALLNKDAKALQEAVKQLVGINNEKAVDAMMRAPLSADQQELYWIVISGMASFTSSSALKEIGKRIQRNQSSAVMQDLLSLLKNNRSPSLGPVLVEIIEKTSEESLKLLVIEILQELKARETVEPLMNLLEKEVKAKRDTELKKRVVATLESITGQKLGDTVSNWKAWWTENKDKAEWTPANSDTPAPDRTGTVVETMDPTTRSTFEKLTKPDPSEKNPEKKVVVVQSDHKHPEGVRNHDFDHIERVLTAFAIPHTIIKKDELENYDLSNAMALLINCNQFREHCLCPDCSPGFDVQNRMYRCVCKRNPPFHDMKGTKMSDRTVQKVAAFVNNNGYLFTEDWVLEELLARGFGAYVKDGQKMIFGSPKPGEVLPHIDVTVLPEIGATSHPYMNRIFGERLKNLNKPQPVLGKNGESEMILEPVVPEKEKIGHKWTIDNESPVIDIKDRTAVTVLMISPELGQKFKANPVAITFGGPASGGGGGKTAPERDPKKMAGGRVLHVLSHFTKQSSKDGEFALQNLLLNFLIEANERRLARQKK